MFDIGTQELIIIFIVALLVFGPKKLPDLAKSLGRAFAEFKRATSELKESLEIDDELKDIKTTFNGMSDEIKEAINVKTGTEPEDQNVAADPDKEKNEKEIRDKDSESPLSDG